MSMAMRGRMVVRVALALVTVGFFLVLADPVSADDQSLMVDRTDDSEDSQCLDAVPNDCSLRGAINRANAGSHVHIGFSIREVTLSAALPPIGGVGTMISAGCGAEVALDALAQSDGAVLVVDADDVTIAYLMIINGPASATSADILIKSGQQIDIHSNYLGLTRDVFLAGGLEAGSCSDPRLARNSAYGVSITLNTRGGPGYREGVAYIYNNYIGCHTADGIYASGVSYVYVGMDLEGAGSGNYIGASVTGSSLGNGGNGVLFDQVTHGAVRNNVISGNGWSGVELYRSSENTVTLNRIGTNVTVTAPIPNRRHGVHIVGTTDAPARDNLIGGPVAPANTIGGNWFSAVLLEGNAVSNTINCNLLGVGWGVNIPNGNAGVALLDGANYNRIGGPGAQPCQFIAGNAREGIYIRNASTNVVGRDTSIYDNGLQGVYILGRSGGPPANGNVVEPGYLGGNGREGVRIQTTSGGVATGNVVQIGYGDGNGALPIDLGGDGHTKNGTRTLPGPNNWIRYPEITAGGWPVITGTVCAACRVDVYQRRGNPAGPGGGGTYLRSVTDDDSNGIWSLDVSALPNGGMAVTSLTFVACNVADGCSEMSPWYPVFLPVQLKAHGE